MKISKLDSDFLSYLRGMSIFIIVFGHVGGFWVYRPYTEFLHVFVPVFFFISGAVNSYSFKRSSGLKNYYIKKMIGLFTPYFLLCLISYITFIFINKRLPEFNYSYLLKWLQIRPSNDIMPFPIGQVWFLHVLLIITLISPLYFSIKMRGLIIVAALIIIVSVFRDFYGKDIGLFFFGNNLYRPLFHSFFYIFGIMYFYFSLKIKMQLSILLLALSLSFALGSMDSINIDYAYHIYSPGIYYLSGSMVAIMLIIYFRFKLIKLIYFFKFEIVLKFFNRHAISIFLLHTFSIFLVEILWSVSQEEKSILYGIIKLFFVIILTSALSVPFTLISTIVSVQINRILIANKHPYNH